MANQTVTTALNYDNASMLGLLNGESITINDGGSVTVNSDVRWGQQAAVVGDININNGELRIDGTETWWVAFTSSTGNVPALGTQGTPDVTRGGSNVGEYLGIWTALGTAPLAPGSAMPATGWIKLRRRSAALAIGDVLTFTGGATATLASAGQRGWLHFVGREATTSANGRALAAGLGRIVVDGDWFELSVSNGSAGQVFQHYVADYCPGLQVETGPGTGVYQWWGACAPADFTAANVATDARGRFYSCSAAGVITFGGATFGRLPPNGARIRVPNVHLSTAAAANYALNSINTASPIYRYRLFGSPGSLDINFLSATGNVTGQSTTFFRVRNSAGMDGCFFGGSQVNSTYHTNVQFQNVASASILGPSRVNFGFAFSENVTFTDVCLFRIIGYDSATPPGSFSALDKFTFTRVEAFSRVAGSSTFDVLNSANGLFDDCAVVSPAVFPFQVNNGLNIASRNYRFASNLVGSSGGAAINAVRATNMNGFLIDGIVLFENLNLPPSNQFAAVENSRNVRFRNVGTRAAPFFAGGGGREFVSLTGSRYVRASRVFFRGPSGYDYSVIGQVASNENVTIADSGWSYAQGVYAQAVTDNGRARRTIGGGQKTYSNGFSSGRTNTVFTARGVHFVEQEVSATEIMLTVMTGSLKTASDFSVNAYTDDAGAPVRDGNNGLLLRTVGDQVTWTWGWYVLGMSSLQNTAPLLDGTNTGNIALTYDLDKGAGFSGTFKALTAANLSAETGISPSVGFRWRLRAACATANAGNLLRAVSIFGNTTQTLLTDNPYPHNDPLVSVSNITPGSNAAIFRNSDGRLLGVEPHTLPRLYPAWYADAQCTFRVRRPGWNEVEAPFTLTEDGAAFPLNQSDNAIADSNPGALGITVTNHGASPVTWNGKQWSITVTVPAGVSASQVAQFLSWQTAQDAFTLGGFHNMAWPVMVVAVGTALETQRGTLFGSAGAALKGVRVVDASENEVPGFARMQADDGSYYSPAASYTLTVSSIVAGSRILIRRTDTQVVLANQTVAGASFGYTYTHAADVPVEIVVRKASASPFYQEWRTTTTLAASNNSQTANQQPDE
jgi:hypothetical protein